MDARRLTIPALLVAGVAVSPMNVGYAQGNATPPSSDATNDANATESLPASDAAPADASTPAPTDTAEPGATTPADAAPKASEEQPPAAPEPGATAAHLGLKPNAFFGAQFGGRFVDADSKKLLGTPLQFGLNLGGWFPFAAQSSMGLHLEANASFSNRTLPPVFNNDESKIVASSVDLPVFLQYGWSPLSWFRLAAGAGGFWRHQQAYIDNPKGVGDDLFADRYFGAAFRLAFEFPTRAGSLPVVPFLSLSHMRGKSSESRKLRYSGKSFAFSGSETSLSIGLALSTPHTSTSPSQ